jgi:4-hydroxybenzoate polyprenyltransferase
MRQAKIENDRKQREHERYTQFLKEQSDRSLNLLGKSNTTTTSTRLKSYMQLMRMNNTAPLYLTFWPSAWSILGAASYQAASMPDFYLLSLFAAGAFTMRSAGCIVNDLWDRDVDAKVERTKDRPLASGRVSVPEAVALLGVNLTASLAVLWQLNLTTQVLGACCLLPVAIYPAAKRFTNWPQALLGVTFNWGALMVSLNISLIYLKRTNL